jgi:hypothetical protein
MGTQGRRRLSGAGRSAPVSLTSASIPPPCGAEPEHEEDEDENDEPAHLGDCNRHAKKPGQNAGVDWVTHHGIGTCGDQLVALVNGDGAAPVAAEVLACPDGEEKAGDGDGGSQPEWPIASRPELDVKPG